MTDEEIRMRCLELAFTYSEACQNTFDLADRFYAYATRDRLLSKSDKIVWEKLSQERNEK